MKAILIATKETIDVIKAEEYTNIYVTEDGSQSFLGGELILLDEVKEEAKERDWEEVRINVINGLCKIYPNCVTYTRFEIKSIDKLIPNYKLMGGM